MDWERPLTFGVLGFAIWLSSAATCAWFLIIQSQRYSRAPLSQAEARICPAHTERPCPDTFLASWILEPQTTPPPKPCCSQATLLLTLFGGVCFWVFLFVFPLLLFFAIGIMFYFWWCFHISSYFSNTPVSFQIYFIFYSLLLFSFLSFSIFLVSYCGMWISVQGPGLGWAPVVRALSLKHWLTSDPGNINWSEVSQRSTSQHWDSFQLITFLNTSAGNLRPKNL